MNQEALHTPEELQALNERPLDECGIAAYRFVDGMVTYRVDSTAGLAPLWHGWALRLAFRAGAEWSAQDPATIRAALMAFRLVDGGVKPSHDVVEQHRTAARQILDLVSYVEKNGDRFGHDTSLGTDEQVVSEAVDILRKAYP